MANLKKIHIEILGSAFKAAVNNLLKYDLPLLEKNAHEQAVSHRIATYLEPFFGVNTDLKLNIDCEYNKRGDADKTADIDILHFWDSFTHCTCDVCRKIKKAKANNAPIDVRQDDRLLRPDILVHKRGVPNRNWIVAEVKKSNICPVDLSKLRALTLPRKLGHDYGYDLGVFLYFQDIDPRYIWFSNGEMF